MRLPTTCSVYTCFKRIDIVAMKKFNSTLDMQNFVNYGDSNMQNTSNSITETIADIHTRLSHIYTHFPHIHTRLSNQIQQKCSTTDFFVYNNFA